MIKTGNEPSRHALPPHHPPPGFYPSTTSPAPRPFRPPLAAAFGEGASQRHMPIYPLLSLGYIPRAVVPPFCSPKASYFAHWPLPRRGGAQQTGVVGTHFAELVEQEHPLHPAHGAARREHLDTGGEKKGGERERNWKNPRKQNRLTRQCSVRGSAHATPPVTTQRHARTRCSEKEWRE